MINDLKNFNVANEKNNKNINFTDDQKIAIDNLIKFIGNPFNENKYIMGLAGAAGTGKTFITKYIIQHCKYVPSVIKCTSPTHKACRVFAEAINNSKVETIQSTFGLRPNLKLEDFDPDNPQFDPLGGVKLDKIRLLLIDEASMIPAKLVNYICKVCKDNKIKIIFIGDTYQLSPINEKQSSAFSKCSKVYNLTQIVRQEFNNPIKELLSLLRKDIDNKSTEFIKYISTHMGEDNYNEINEGFTICSPSTFKNIIDKSFVDEEYKRNIDTYRIVGYTNACVSAWNNYIRSIIIPNQDKNIITKNDLIMAYETIVNEFGEIIINNSEEYIVNDIGNFVDSNFEFKGFLVKFQLVHGGDITKPLFILDHKDKYTVQRYYKIINDLKNAAKTANSGTKASKWKDFYNFKKTYILAANIIDRYGRIVLSRDIDYGFAITSHKAQGSTYDTVFVDINDMIFDKTGKPYTDYNDLLRRLYVACSRAHTRLILSYGK